jgi:hypothetical protein
MLNQTAKIISQGLKPFHKKDIPTKYAHKKIQ